MNPKESKYETRIDIHGNRLMNYILILSFRDVRIKYGDNSRTLSSKKILMRTLNYFHKLTKILQSSGNTIRIIFFNDEYLEVSYINKLLIFYYLNELGFIISEYEKETDSNKVFFPWVLIKKYLVANKCAITSNFYIEKTIKYRKIIDKLFVADKYSKEKIAHILWKDKSTIISDSMQRKVHFVQQYLKVVNLDIGGVNADGDCWFNAFLESYKVSGKKIPILDENNNKVTFLREHIVSFLANLVKSNNKVPISDGRLDQIKKLGEWITSNEGEVLTKVLKICLRIITVNEYKNNIGIDDTIVFSETKKPNKNWSIANQTEKDNTQIVIIDLGGHFVFASFVRDAEIFNT